MAEEINEHEAKHKSKSMLHKMLNNTRILLGIALGSVVAVFSSGWVAYAQVRDTSKEVATGVVKVEVVPLSKRVDALEDQLKVIRQEAKEQRTVTDDTNRKATETQLNMRLMLESRGITPIKLVESKDGGS